MDNRHLRGILTARALKLFIFLKGFLQIRKICLFKESLGFEVGRALLRITALHRAQGVELIKDLPSLGSNLLLNHLINFNYKTSCLRIFKTPRLTVKDAA